MTITSRLFIGVAVTALLAGGAGARAQTAAPPPTTGLQEVIVTAQKRPENAQKAPLAVTSLNADTLTAAHVTGATDLSRVVPDVKVSIGGAAGDPGGATAVFTIRGLGASATGPQGSAGVAVHFDGIYSQVGVSNSEFFDLERVEVDPGPQGTLYGRSAAAGAIDVVPNKPTKRFEGEVTLEGGNYGEIRSEGFVNIPVNDQLFLRGAFQTQDHDGYLSNGYDDLDAQAFRLQALYQPNDRLSIRAYGDYLHLGGKGASDIFESGATLPYIASLAPVLNSSDPRDRSIAQYCFVNGQLTQSCNQRTDATKWSTHLDISYDLGWGVLSLIPSYSEANQNDTYANAPLPFSYYNLAPFDDHQTNFEMRLNSAASSAIKWVGGFNIYHNEVSDNVNQSVAPLAGDLPVFGAGLMHPPTGFAPGVIAVNASNDQKSEQDSYAAFGQVTYPVQSWLRVTVGGRYNYDEASYDGALTTNSQLIYYVNGPLFPPPLAGPTDITTPVTTGPLSSKVDFHAFTYRVAVDADLTPTSLVYASIGSGYKPGGLSDGASPSANSAGQLTVLGSQLTPALTAAQVAQYAPNNAFGPEKVTHYEVGSKNRFWNNRLQINDALYYDDYSNYQNGQTEVVNPLIYRVQGFIVTNAGKAEVYGNELSAKFQATPNDVLGASLNYLHATFTSYVAPGYLTPSGAAPAVNLAGKPLPNAPEWSSNLSYQHFMDLPDGSQLVGSVFSSLSDGYWTDYAESLGTHQGAFTRTTLDLTWNSASRLWKVTGFVNNLEDAVVKSFGLASAGYSQVHLDPPRTFGVSVSRRF